MIEIVNAKKILGDKEVLKHISLKVSKGNIFGLIGQNGTGKTTLIKCMTGIWKLDGGTIKINGEEVFENVRVKETIGYVADVNNYYNSMKIKKIIKFYQLTYQRFDRNRYEELNKIFEIDEDKYIRQLSKGMKMSFAIMLNLCIMPEVLILDEPTSGLDPIIKNKVIDLLIDDVAKRQTTIFISSHNLVDLERICDGIAIIKDGNVEYTNSVENIKKNTKKLQVIFKENPPEDLMQWGKILSLVKVGKAYNIIVDEAADEIINKLKTEAMFVEELDLSLEEIFIYLVGGEDNNEEIKQISC